MFFRINKGIQNQASNSLKRKAESNGLGTFEYFVHGFTFFLIFLLISNFNIAEKFLENVNIYGTPFTLFINIQKHEYINAHGKYSTDVGPIMRKARPSNAENESDISTLEKEIR